MRCEAPVPVLPFPFSHFTGRAENRSRSCGRPVGRERAGPHPPRSWGHRPPRTHSPRCSRAHPRELGPQAQTCSSSAAGAPRVTCLLKRHSSQDNRRRPRSSPPLCLPLHPAHRPPLSAPVLGLGMQPGAHQDLPTTPPSPWNRRMNTTTQFINHRIYDGLHEAPCGCGLSDTATF